MKTLFIEAHKKFKKINFSKLANLPGKTISLASAIQYIDLIPKIKFYLKSIGKIPIIKPSNILGCNSKAFDKKADTLLLLADGKFHAINNAVQLNKEIYIFDTYTLTKITKQEINEIQAKIKAKQKKFLLYNNIGIITSTKPGQNYSSPFQLREKIQKLGKKVHIFEADTINLQELENFPIQLWINTACPGLGIENPNIVNLQNIEEFL